MGKAGFPSGAARDEVLGAFYELGGREYLKTLARSKKDRHLFTSLLGRCIPTAQELSGPKGGPIEQHILAVATKGLGNLSDDQLAQFRELLDAMGAADPLLAGVKPEVPANDPVPAAPEAPKEAAA